MAGTAYPKRAIKQNRRTTRAKIGKPVKLARMGEIDYTFLFIVILLLSFGLVMLLSASAPAGNTFGFEDRPRMEEQFKRIQNSHQDEKQNEIDPPAADYTR